MALRLVVLRPPSRLYRLLPLMPAVFFAYLIAMIILLFALRSLQLFALLFFTLLLVLIAFNLVLILQYGFTLSKLIGDATTPKLLLAYLAATYTVMLVLPVAIFLSEHTEMGVESAFAVIGLEAFVGATLAALTIIASLSTAPIAVAIPAALTAIMLLASAILIGIGAKSAHVPLAASLFTIFHSLFNQPFANALLLAFAHDPLYSGIIQAVGHLKVRTVLFIVWGESIIVSWSWLIVTSILLAFAYTPGILSIATLSWLAYKAYKVTGKTDFKYAAIAITLEAITFLILIPHVTITVAFTKIVGENFGGFLFLIAMTSMLLILEQAAKWYIAIRPLMNS